MNNEKRSSTAEIHDLEAMEILSNLITYSTGNTVDIFALSEACRRFMGKNSVEDLHPVGSIGYCRDLHKDNPEYHEGNRFREIYQRDVEDHFELSHATVSGLIARLEAKGFLVSIPGERDKRYKRLCATEKALCCDQQMGKNIEQTEQLILRGFSAEETQQLHQYLERISCNLGIDIDEVRKKRRKEK